ncbi:RHS repeat domain-containing protein [Ramlibacter sp. WS9]|uniref:RHS repeat domain-containing protein n=1 Tax=Ramlibacter sp. WS9 TaxID=1882741 RepID=UPI001142F47C|nr:RHS repeat-associated core domain-containing protein [Ramlibacter sp. WS9]ROZ75274.1 RHS repeat-associated core domain-containing protein [Ramlibacter sp. WS9]
MSDSSLPTIRSFELDASTVGLLKSSVNLFRGEVNLSHPLLTLPGRMDKDGLQIDLAVQYQSNVDQISRTWNRDQPTSVLGMGWNLPLSLISLNSTAIARGARSYTLTTAKTVSQLVRETPTALFQTPMTSQLQAELDSGSDLSGWTRLLGSLGLPLSPSAVAIPDDGSGLPVPSDASTTYWLLRDDQGEREFRLAVGASLADVFDGGESYQAVHYLFWRIVYFERYQRWMLLTDSGQQLSFGGGVAPGTNTFATSRGNSVEWGVCWKDASGAPAWQGNSSQAPSDQIQFATVWHQESAWSRYGEAVHFGYNEFAARGADGALVDVEQLVAAGGQPYTKACYLTSITDVFGREVQFQYNDKIWNDDAPANPREYADPHKAKPSTLPNGFQDRYETKYLDRIEVLERDGTTRMLGIQFEYAPSPGSAYPAVANYAPNVSGGLTGDTCKRMLTGIHLENRDGLALPGYRFGYLGIGDDAVTPTFPGALESIQWPSGGKALYSYASNELQICQRGLDLKAPSTQGQGDWSPRVWFGKDFAVVLWLYPLLSQVALQIASWDGQWTIWTASEDMLILDGTTGPDLNTLDVSISESFVAITYQTANKTNLSLYRQDPARPGQWVAADLGGAAGVLNNPTRSWDLQNGPIQFVVGDNFVLAPQNDSFHQTASCDRIRWDWQTAQWILDTQNYSGQTWFAGQAEYYVTLGASGALNLWHLDPLGAWVGGLVALQIPNLYVSDPANLEIGLGSSMVVIVNGTKEKTYWTADVYLAAWNRDYVLPAQASSFLGLQESFGKSNTSWDPSVVTDSFVAVGGSLFRFNGSSWLLNANLVPPLVANDSSEKRYAYGPDYGVLVQLQSGSPTVKVLAYDASTDDAAWLNAQPVNPTGYPSTPLDDNQALANWPTAGTQDYLVIGTQVFFRGTQTDWGQAVLGTALADLNTLVNQGETQYQINTQTFSNQGPAFLSFAAMELSSQNPVGDCAAVLLRNGQLVNQAPDAQVIAGQCMWTPAEGAQVPGVVPTGPRSFVTYPSEAQGFVNAQSIRINRYADEAVGGPVEAKTVTAIQILDGLSDATTTTYNFDPTNARWDDAGNFTKYFSSEVIPDSAPGTRDNGSVVSCYLNGKALPADLQGQNLHNALDGLLHSITSLDKNGATLVDVTYVWTAFTQRSSGPAAAALSGPAAVLNTNGAYVLQTAVTTTRDGVVSNVAKDYSPALNTYTFTGQPARVTTQRWCGSGAQETLVQTSAYAAELDPASRILNDRTSLLRQATFVDGVAISASAVVTHGCQSFWGDQVLVPGEFQDYGWLNGATDFDASDTSGWNRTTEVRARAANGSPLEQLDGSGTVQSTLIDPALGLPIARFTGAALAECAWNGFQSCEQGVGWTLVGTSVCLDDACLGTQSLRLPVGAGASVATSVVPGGDRTRYLLGCRYKTTAGYQAQGSGIAVTGGTAATLAFGDTQGKWTYATLPIDLPAGCPGLSLLATNTGTSDLLLEGVLLVPFGTEATIQTWLDGTRLPLATMGTSGGASRTFYDLFRSSLGSVGADDQLQELQYSFVSPTGDPAGNFSDASPGAQIDLKTPGGGHAESFRDGQDWKLRWSVDPTWTAANGALCKPVSSDSQTLSYCGPSLAGQTVAWFFECQPTPLQPTQPVRIQFGGGQSIGWVPAQGWTWLDASGQTVQAALAHPPAMATKWLLVQGEGIVLFLADGQLLFSKRTPSQLDGTFALVAGTDALAIQNLSWGLAPRLGICYTDGASRKRQAHQLDRADASVMEIIYDGLDRPVAQTKSIPGSFGANQNAEILQYRSSLVDVANFLASRDATAAMEGDAADYYAGGDSATSPSDDQGYPYQGTRYETGASKRPIERGLPGKPYAMYGVEAGPYSQGLTAKIAYGTTDAADPFPAGQFYAQDNTSPGGTRNRSLKDTSKRLAALMSTDSAQTLLGRVSVTPTYKNFLGNPAQMFNINLPNAFGATAEPATSFFRNLAQDPVGNPSYSSDPSSGGNTLISDGKGHTRFTQVPLEPGENFFAYSTYDTLGRLVEEGLVQAQWDAALLQSKADDLQFPGAQDGAVPSRRYTFDGDGTDPCSLGKLVRAETYNPAPTLATDQTDYTVVQTFSYDALGRIVTGSMEIPGLTPSPLVARYTYNTLNEIERIDYPPGSPLEAVVYGYNQQAQLVSLGTPQNPEGLATYTWTPNGLLETCTRGALSETWRYDSRSLVDLHAASNAAGEIFSQSYTHDPDGNVATRTTQGPSRQNPTVNTGYGYDGSQRLTSATVSTGPGNLSLTAYDLNGNILSGVQDGKTFGLTLKSGTDCLAQSSLDGETDPTYAYRSDGRPTQWRGIEIEYQLGLGMASGAKSAGGEHRWVYGLANVQAMHSDERGIQIDFCGAGATALVSWLNGVATANALDQNEIVASVSDATRYPVKDALGTVWVVAGETGEVVANFDYAPFGGILSATGTDADLWRYRFGGREWLPSLGVYNFRARLYDPAVRRFLTPDQQAQYASPYVFVGNNPLNLADPTGNKSMSVGAQVGMGFLMALVGILGAVLTMFSGGASDAIASSFESLLAGAAEGEEVVGEAAAGEGAANAAGGLSTAGKVVKFGANVVMQTTSSAAMGAAVSSIGYSIKNGSHAQWGDYRLALARGAGTWALATGIAAPATSAAFLSWTAGLGRAVRIASEVAAAAGAQAVGNMVAQVVVNAAEGNQITKGQVMTGVVGLLTGGGATLFTTQLTMDASKEAFVTAQREIPKNQSDTLLTRASKAWSESELQPMKWTPGRQY